MSSLNQTRTRFLILIITGLSLAPLAGLSSALLYGLVSRENLADPAVQLYTGGFIALVLLGAGTYFYSYFNPLKINSAAAARRIDHFGRDYWTCFLLCALAIPPLFYYAIDTRITAEPARFLQFVLLQLSVVILVGLPTYQLALDQIGRLAGYLSLHRIQVSLKSRMLLLGGFLPLLCYSLLMNYHWHQGGGLSSGQMAIWLALVCITGLVTLFSVRSVTQALEPIQELVQDNGASLRSELARLQPRSTDEIGYITRIIGKLFEQLGEQDAQLRAVVETTDSAILVSDAVGNIDVANPAAENLFGFRAAELRRQSLRDLLPQLFDTAGTLQATRSERETEALHSYGHRLQVGVRCSPLTGSKEPRFTLILNDIGRRKGLERRLREAESRYRELVETAQDIVWTLDTDGRLTYVNRACNHVYGYQPGSMLGHSLHEFRSPDHPPRDQEAIEELLHGRDSVQFETVHLDAEGKPHFLGINARSHKDPAGFVTHVSGMTRDITEQKAFQHQLSYNAEHDPLTGLFNRNYFQEELERTVARVARSGTSCALLYIDLDQFRYINDTLGHAAGDRLLVDIGAILSAHVREGDLLARFGGDEFTLLLYNINAGDVISVADNFRTLCDEYTFNENGRSWNVTASIGIAMIDRTSQSAEEVLSHADLACNLAKQQGRNRINLYNPDDLGKADMQADMSWANQVRTMLEQDRFQLVYQPIVAASDGALLDYEVLVRMVCDDGQIILPGGFMPAAERFGLIHSVDRWIVQRAIEQLARLHADGNPAHFSINLSGKAFEDDTLLPMIRKQLDTTGLDPSHVTFEITETAAIANLAAAEEFISALKDIGCQFALDDFGSGFSSFAYLKHLPVDKLKIDGAFVKGMAHSSVDQAMVESMNQVAHALGKITVAECVENEATLKILRDMHVDRAQGNFIGRPDVLPGPQPPHAGTPREVRTGH